MSRLDGAAQANIPQVASRLAPRSPDFVHRTSVFRPERCLDSRERLELGASDRKSAVLCPGGGGFRRSGQTCPMACVHLGSRSDHTHDGSATRRCIAARMAVSIAPVIAISASWEVMVRA